MARPTRNLLVLALALLALGCPAAKGGRIGGVNVSPSGGTTKTPGGSVAGSATNLAQTSWYIDPVNGVDTNDGLTSGTALKTHAELEARWGYGGRLTHGWLRYWAGPNTTLYSGSTAFRTGVLSSVTAQSAATNQDERAIDVAISSWASVINKRLRITSGAHAGHSAWVAKDLGGGAGAALGAFSSPITPVAVLPAIGTFSNTDPYQIDTQIAATYGDVAPTYNAGGTSTFTDVFVLSSLPTPDPINFHLSIKSLDFRDFAWSTASFPYIQGVANTNFVGCSFPAIQVTVNSLQNIKFTNCNFQYAFVLTSGYAALIGGLMTDLAQNGSTVYVVGGVLDAQRAFQARGTNGFFAAPGGFLQITSASIFDTYAYPPYNQLGSGLVVGGDSDDTVYGGCGTVRIPANALFGTGNAGYGIDVFAGCSVGMGGAQYITGSTGTGAFILGQNAANSRGFNDATGVYTPVITNTWANFTATIAGGGFGGNAHNVAKDAHLLTVP